MIKVIIDGVELKILRVLFATVVGLSGLAILLFVVYFAGALVEGH